MVPIGSRPLLNAACAAGMFAVTCFAFPMPAGAHTQAEIPAAAATASALNGEVHFSPLAWEQRFRQDLPDSLSVTSISPLGFTTGSPPSLLVALHIGRSVEPRSEIWLASITGVRKKRILKENEKRVTFYLASTDGRYVAYVCVPPPPPSHGAASTPGGGGKHSELWVVQVATGAKSLCTLLNDGGDGDYNGYVGRTWHRRWIITSTSATSPKEHA